MADHLIRLDREEDGWECTFYCGELPADDAIKSSGREPNGYFWEGMAQFIEPKLVDKIEFDSEAGMFAAYGKRRHLKRLRESLEPYLVDGRRTVATVEAAAAQGFAYDD